MSKNLFSDMLTDVKKATEASNSRPSAYLDTVGRELCRKLKCKIFWQFRICFRILKAVKQDDKIGNPRMEDSAF